MAIGTEFTEMGADVQAAFSHALTVRRVTARSISTTTGIRAETVTNYSVDLERGRTEDDFTPGGSRVKARTYTMVATAISLGGGAYYIPDREDYVIDGSETWRVVRRESIVDAGLVKLFCHEWNGVE